MASEPSWMDDFFLTVRYRLDGDATDVAHITAPEVVAEADATVEPRSKIGHITTEDDTPGSVALFTLVDNERRRIDIIVTATNADGTKGGTWQIRAQVRREAGIAVLVSGGTDPDPDVGNTADLDFELGVDGDDVVAIPTGLPAEDFTFGWEVRSQKQVIEA